MTHLDIWKAVCRAIEEVSAYSPDQHARYMESATLLPPMIPIGDGRHVLTTQAGVEALAKLGEAWRASDPDRRARVTPERMRQLAIAEFGEMLGENQLVLWPDSSLALKAYKKRLAHRLAGAFRDTHHYFACRVVDADSVAPFSIGRVQFVRPQAWLDKVQEVAGCELDWIDGVRVHWRDTTPLPQLGGIDRILAETAVETIGACKWVAQVSVAGNDIGRSAERARFGVRLALDGLGLVMTSAQGLNLRGPGDDTDPGITTRLSQAPGENLSFSSHRDLPLLLTHEPHASQFMRDSEDLRAAVGWAIEAVFCLPAEITLFDLRRRWCDALYWFGEARRDDTGAAAIVRYGMCLDVLAKGGAAPEIIKMVASLFGRTAKDGLLSDGTSVEQAVAKLYNRGRSQIGHGGAPALLEDTPIERGAADNICRRTLNRYLYALKSYEGVDDATTFLSNLRPEAGGA